jgi:hypothetical protein
VEPNWRRPHRRRNGLRNDVCGLPREFVQVVSIIAPLSQGIQPISVSLASFPAQVSPQAAVVGGILARLKTQEAGGIVASMAVRAKVSSAHRSA